MKTSNQTNELRRLSEDTALWAIRPIIVPKLIARKYSVLYSEIIYTYILLYTIYYILYTMYSIYTFLIYSVVHY